MYCIVALCSLDIIRTCENDIIAPEEFFLAVCRYFLTCYETIEREMLNWVVFWHQVMGVISDGDTWYDVSSNPEFKISNISASYWQKHAVKAVSSRYFLKLNSCITCVFKL